MPFVEFYAITAGSIPPDPVKLLSSRRMQRLMKRLERDFDMIVYDAPPLVGLADATLVAPHTDGVILVSRVNRSDRNVLRHAVENIRLAKLPVLGLVANGVTTSGDGYKYYAYGYEPTAAPAEAGDDKVPALMGGSKGGLTAASFMKGSSASS